MTSPLLLAEASSTPVETVTSQVLLFIATGIFGFIGVQIVRFVDEVRERDKRAFAERDQEINRYFVPLSLTLDELKPQLIEIRNQLKGNPPPGPVFKNGDSTDPQNMKAWVQRLKDFVVDLNSGWTESDRFQQLTMYGGGSGSAALSAWYLAAAYLYYATRIRFDTSIGAATGIRERLLNAVNNTRTLLGKQRFYPLSQDATGAAMKAEEERVIDYGEFAARVTNLRSRGFFLTLADYFFELGPKSDDEFEKLVDSLDWIKVIVDEQIRNHQRKRK